MDYCELYKVELGSRTHQKVGGSAQQSIKIELLDCLVLKLLQNRGSYLLFAQVSIHRLNAEASTCAGF